jgi:hypothetical protein
MRAVVVLSCALVIAGCGEREVTQSPKTPFSDCAAAMVEAGYGLGAGTECERQRVLYGRYLTDRPTGLPVPVNANQPLAVHVPTRPK